MLRRARRGLAALIGAAVLASCGVGAPPSDDSELVEPLVPDDDSELVEPLVPAGTDLASRYRVVLTYSSRDDMGELGGGLGGIREGWIEHEDRFEGEVLATAEGRWVGELTGTATGQDRIDATLIGVGDYTCSSSWDATQAVDLTLEVLDESDLTGLVTDPEPGAVYASITLDSIGSVDYADPMDECDPTGAGGGEEDLSEFIAPLGPTGDDEFAPFGAYSCVHDQTCHLHVMLPPTGYGKLIERVDESVAGFSEAEWVFELEALD
jgi:hypothetical protein